MTRTIHTGIVVPLDRETENMPPEVAALLSDVMQHLSDFNATSPRGHVLLAIRDEHRTIVGAYPLDEAKGIAREIGSEATAARLDGPTPDGRRWLVIGVADVGLFTVRINFRRFAQRGAA